jgi:phenylacetate-coenzyme A ligase PaaK-like adenylate-forming protein
MNLPYSYDTLFNIRSDAEFRLLANLLYKHQYANNAVYRDFADHLGIKPGDVKSLEDIPFLPVSFFKTHDIVTGSHTAETIFYSSGTTGSELSRHHVADLSLYNQSLLKGFELAFGPVTNYSFFALLPSYHENNNASLLYMVDQLIRNSRNPGGFYLDNTEELVDDMIRQGKKRKVMLIGVSYALLDLAEKQPDLSGVIVIETGGMKGRRKEMTKEDLHHRLKEGFAIDTIGSEYGMTELLSQAWSTGNGVFRCPPWMRILTRDTSDPLSYVNGQTGGVNIIDLANIHSCGFIGTQDLGRMGQEGFEIVGRFDNADIRGCNLLVG